MRRIWTGPVIAMAGALTLPSSASAQNWVATWATSPLRPNAEQGLKPEQQDGATVRQIVRLSIGGQRMRLRVTNAFGTAPLTLSGVHLARAQGADGPATVAGTDRRVTFAGRDAVTIPPGADWWSDPIALDAPALADIAISMRIAGGVAGQSGHWGSRATSWILPGDRLADPAFAGATGVDQWFQTAGIEVEAPVATRSVVAFGDSITDGYGVKPNTNTRWTDFLARRMAADPATRSVALLNHGIGGNCVLRECLGPNALARMERDVLSQPGLSHIVLLEGVNDLGGLGRERPASPEQYRDHVAAITAGYAQIVARAHASGVRVIGGTVTPFVGNDYYHPDANAEAARQALNAWIRTPGNFDAVIDFDAAIRDPARPDRMRAAYDSGDHLHPSVAGYEAMAKAVPLRLLATAPAPASRR